MTAPPTPVVLLAHGSPDPRHARGVEALATRVRTLAPSRPVHTAYLDHHPPTPGQAAEAAGSGPVVPILLTPAYHVRVDVPAAIASMNATATGPFWATDPLGPDPLLLQGIREVLDAAGMVPDPGTAVVLYAAGSSDSAAVATIVQTLAAHPPEGPGGHGGWRPSTAARRCRPFWPDSPRASGGPSRCPSWWPRGSCATEWLLRVPRRASSMVPGTLGDTDAVAQLVLGRADSQQRVPTARRPQGR